MKKFLVLLLSFCALTVQAQKKIVHPQPKPQTTSPSKTKPTSTPTKSRVSPKKADYTLTVRGVNYSFIYVEPGTFSMGATPEVEECRPHETPAHEVTLTKGYYIGQTEVTQALWKAVMDNNPSAFKGDNLPVETVSWHDVQEFIARLNEMTGKQFRLPTEAEWEFAARGGNKSHHTQYSGAKSLASCGWYWGRKSHPVAMKQANELGIYDMSGNVWEWCQDKCGRYYSKPVVDPICTSASDRVTRGGGWDNAAECCSVARRWGINSDTRLDSVGLRLALSATE